MTCVMDATSGLHAPARTSLPLKHRNHWLSFDPGSQPGSQPASRTCKRAEAFRARGHVCMSLPNAPQASTMGCQASFNADGCIARDAVAGEACSW